MLRAMASDLVSEARRADERRAVVLAGEHDATLEAARAVLEGAELTRRRTVLIGKTDVGWCDRVPPDRAGTLLGETTDAVVFDAHEGLDPNAVGRTVGTVTGGGLYVLCTPPLERWPDRRDDFDETLAVPPFDVAAVGGRFRRRFVHTVRVHPGIAVVDVDAARVRDGGLTHPAPRLPDSGIDPPSDPVFPDRTYEACRTQDQADALSDLEVLTRSGSIAVVEADRGRGKSSVAGLAAGALAARGDRVLVTAPEYRSAAEAFARARCFLRAEVDDEGGASRVIRAPAGGEVRYVAPSELGDSLRAGDALVVDEAAALGLDVLETTVAADRVAYVTTVHGYEGAGRGFSVRFRDRLDALDRPVTEIRLSTPIRYAPGDPVEVWSFRALLLNATPAPAEAIRGATTEGVTHRRLDPDVLLEDEALLREVFGLLVLAHYRTEPADVARLLDAPNVRVHALLEDGHVAAVALLAREGGLPATTRAEMYAGARVRGNMLPDVLTTQLRDEAAADPVGWRVMRIATHAAVRSRGLGSHLLSGLRSRLADDVDWLGVGYGVTPRLLSFWRENGFGTVHLSLTRNETSGEHSVLMLDPTSDRGETLHDRHATWFPERSLGTLTDVHADLEPDLVRAVLRSVETTFEAGLSADEWRRVAGMAYGPGLIDVDPYPFRRLAMAHLVDPRDPGLLTPRQERLLVMKPLQARRWDEVVETLGFDSRGQALRALGEAYRPLVDTYGDDAARAERARFEDDDANGGRP